MVKSYLVKIYVTTDENSNSSPLKAKLTIDQATGLIDYKEEGSENCVSIRNVKIGRKSNSFGISIKGGKEHSRPIMISKCDQRHLDLNVGDRIISCNDKSMVNATHKEAVEAIQSGTDTTNLQIRRESWKTTSWPISLPIIYSTLGTNSLWMARLSRATKFGDHCIEVASACLTSRLVIKCETEAVADDCVLALQRTKNHFANMKLFNKNLSKNTTLLKSDHFLKDLNTAAQYCIRMDWVFHEEDRKHYLMMLTSQELRFYNALPKYWDDWSKPVYGTPLLSSHIIEHKSNILLRAATQREVNVVEYRCSSVANWIQSIQEARNQNVRDVKEALVEVIYDNSTTYLGVHWLEGIRLYDARTRKVLLHKDCGDLSKIEDDNLANLILHFKDNSTHNLVLGDGLKPFIFVMLNFYAAKAMTH